MRRTLLCLAACAILAPVSAQEQIPAPTTPSTVTVTPNTNTRTRLFSRRGNDVIVVPGTMSTTTTVVNGQPITMEPVYNSRGRLMGYREVVKPATTVTKTETTNPVTQTGNTEPKVEKTETKVVTNTVPQQPMPEQRRGILSRIFRR